MDVKKSNAAHPRKASRGLVMGLAACLLSGSALAQSLAIPTEAWQVFVAAGQSVAHGSDSENLFVGILVPRHAPRPVGHGTLTTYWEAFGGQWRGRGVWRSSADRRSGRTQVAADLAFKFRPALPKM